MSTVDSWLEGFMHGGASLALVLVVSLLLGLRHASDPDHLAAVTTLVASEKQDRLKKATKLGALWGAGHATTLVIIGLPLVLLGHYLPDLVVRTAEVTIGLIIALLAIRLLLRWRQGLFHAHSHSHSDGLDESHRHLHSHSEEPSHKHTHTVPVRMPLTSYSVGLVHGVGGSLVDLHCFCSPLYQVERRQQWRFYFSRRALLVRWLCFPRCSGLQ